MTEAEIEAEANRRLAERAVAEPDAAGVPIDTSEIYTRLQASQRAKSEAEAQAKEEQESKGPSSSLKPAVNAVNTVIGSLPPGMQNDAKTVAEMLGSSMAGRALRGSLPQEQVYGTKPYELAQEQAQAMHESAGPMESAANTAEQAILNANDQHRQKLQALQQAHAQAQQEHAANLQELSQAQKEHLMAQALSPEDVHAPRAAAPLAPPAQATPTPMGGEGTANYAQKFGATAPEANLVSSMSEMQKSNIPAQQSAFEKIKAIAPGYLPVAESPLILGPEGQQAAAQRAQQQAAAQTQMQDQQAQAKRDVDRMVAKQKAEAQLRLENAQEQARLSHKQQEAARKSLEMHANTPPMGATEQARHQQTMSDFDALRQRLEAQNPSTARKVLTTIGTRFAPRMVPGVGAAFAPIEAESAYKHLKAGNYGRAAAHGLGALGALAQATGIPPIMGAGDIAQIPAAALSVYDTLND
jgi:hypothetical protein